MCMMGAVAGMCTAGISDVDCALLDVVARSSICRATVNGMLVVEASASRVELNELIAHDDSRWFKCWSVECWLTTWRWLHAKGMRKRNRQTSPGPCRGPTSVVGCKSVYLGVGRGRGM